MSTAVEAERPMVFRDVFVIGDKVLIVTDDPELTIDSDYAKGVPEALREAWGDDDYFFIIQVLPDGSTNGVGGMAGYGGPRKAAEAFARDYAE